MGKNTRVPIISYAWLSILWQITTRKGALNQSQCQSATLDICFPKISYWQHPKCTVTSELQPCNSLFSCSETGITEMYWPVTPQFALTTFTTPGAASFRLWQKFGVSFLKSHNRYFWFVIEWKIIINLGTFTHSWNEATQSTINIYNFSTFVSIIKGNEIQCNSWGREGSKTCYLQCPLKLNV